MDEKIRIIFINLAQKKCFTVNVFYTRFCLDEADKDQVKLLIQIMDFKDNTKLKDPWKK